MPSGPEAYPVGEVMRVRKTVFVVTEQRASASEAEARETVRQRVQLWLKRMLQSPTGP